MTEKKIVGSIIKAYVKVMGEDKWNSLTAEEQHNVIMILVKNFYKAIA